MLFSFYSCKAPCLHSRAILDSFTLLHFPNQNCRSVGKGWLDPRTGLYPVLGSSAKQHRRSAAARWTYLLARHRPHNLFRRRPRPFAAADSLHLRASLKRRPTRVFPRGAPFGAIIPGDGVAEQVFTTGISSFLCAPARNVAVVARAAKQCIALTSNTLRPRTLVVVLTSAARPKYMHSVQGAPLPDPEVAHKVMEQACCAATRQPAGMLCTSALDCEQPATEPVLASLPVNYQVVITMHDVRAVQEPVQHGDYRARAADLVSQRAGLYRHAACVRPLATLPASSSHCIVRKYTGAALQIQHSRLSKRPRAGAHVKHGGFTDPRLGQCVLPMLFHVYLIAFVLS